MSGHEVRRRLHATVGPGILPGPTVVELQGSAIGKACWSLKTMLFYIGKSLFRSS